MFTAGFLAASLLPVSSEIVLVALVAGGLSPLHCVMAATAGNVLGAVLNYAVGYWGGALLLKRVLGMGDAQVAAAVRRFEKYGKISLLFAWVPVVGDPLTVAAGLLRIHPGLFLFLVSIGKSVRYYVLAGLVPT